jgi:Secretory lipase
MRTRVGGLMLVPVLALGLAACSGSDDDVGGGSGGGEAAEATTTSLEPFSGGDFFAVPDPLPEDEHGTLIRYEPDPALEVDGATSYRIMYLSESVAGDAIAVTGTATVPTAPAADGGRPIVSLAHGTTGIADECAPSKTAGGNSGSLGIGLFTGPGAIVANTDYEGLGTPGRHPYLVGESEGRSVLDAALAARQLPDADAGTALGLFGYSQGGHGALWAGQLAPTWAPELDLVGTVAGAPATELPIILGAGARSAGGFVMMMVAGFHEAYPDAPLSTLLTPEGEAALDTVDTGCTGEVLGAFREMDTAALFQPGGAQAEPWAKLMEENNPGTVATEGPILVLNSAADELVPNALVNVLYQRMCSEGQVVERRVYQEGQGHVGAAPAAYTDGAAWLQGRFDGAEPTTTCR